jgi:adenine deaminase
MRDPGRIQELIDGALGRSELDLVVRGGRLLDVYQGEWFEGDVGIKSGRIVHLGPNVASAREQLDASGKWVVPGFFDSHFHAGGCHLSPTRLAEALLMRGTTSTVCDFQEHYVVAGVDAARFALDEARAAGLRVFYLVPLHMFVVDELGVSGKGMRVDDMLQMLEWPETVAINEPPPGPVLGKNPEALEVISRALAMRKVYTGHAPELSGAQLQAYASTGASSDHESTRAGDAWDKLRLGMKVIMREGSAAPDMANLVELAREKSGAVRHMMLGTDEVDPVDLATKGHMDHKVRLAISSGIDAVAAYQMVSLNVAEYYRVDHDVGSLAPGRYGDVVILNDPESVEIDSIVAEGRVVLDRGQPRWSAPETDYPDLVMSRVVLNGGVSPSDFSLRTDQDPARVRVIELQDGNLVSKRGVASLQSIQGSVTADPSQDVLKMAVIERYRGSRQLGISFVRGLGFKEGAVATTYAHPYYNVLTVGVDDESISLAVNRLAELGGGMTVARGGSILHEWRLPIVGTFSNQPLGVIKDEFVDMNEQLKRLGCTFKAPVLALSFAALVTIPDYGLTSKGLYDVERGEFVSPYGEQVS